MALKIKNLRELIGKAQSTAKTLKVVVDNAKDVVDAAKPLVNNLKSAVGKKSEKTPEESNQKSEPKTEPETTPERPPEKTAPKQTPDEKTQEAIPEVIPRASENSGIQAKNNVGANIAMNSFMNATNPVGLVSNLISTIGDVQKFCEVEKTKRCEIEKEKTIAVKTIEEQTKIFMTYLEKSFDERKENFQELFTRVDSAIKAENTEMLAYLLDSINKLAAASPFKDLANLNNVQNKLQDKSAEWNF